MEREPIASSPRALPDPSYASPMTMIHFVLTSELAYKPTTNAYAVPQTTHARRPRSVFDPPYAVDASLRRISLLLGCVVAPREGEP